MFHNYMFRPLFKTIFRLYTLGLESNVSYVQMYYIDDEICHHYTLLVLLWRVCRYWLLVWVGRDGTMFVSYCSVTVVLSGIPYAAQSLRCLLRGWCV